MPRSLTHWAAVLAVLVILPSGRAQSLGEAARYLIDQRTSVEFGCLVNGDRDIAARERVNALVWEASPTVWRAVVANTGVPRATSEQPPCWAAPGRCAVYQGALPDFAAECTPTRAGMDFAGVATELLVIARPTNYGAAVLGGGEDLMRLARGLESQDTLVTARTGADVYMSEAADGALTARFVIGSHTVRIARLRSSPGTIDPARLLVYVDRLGTADLATAGPFGAVSPSGLVTYRENCFRLARPEVFRARLKAAEDMLPLSNVPAPGEDSKAALSDLLQLLIGANFAHGPSPGFAIEQDPRIFISSSGNGTTCPG